MNIWETRLNFRPRSGWEALDLGARLFQERPWLYMGVWASLSLPVYALVLLLCWQRPQWAGLLIWWLKPLFEAPVLWLMSQQVFEPLPPYRQCVRAALGQMWRPRLIGDLTWRRFSFRRSLVLPVTLLERLSGQNHQRRCNELSRQSGGGAVWLTFFGIHLEMILSLGLLSLLFWLWVGDPAQNIVGNPFSGMRSTQALTQIGALIDAGEGRVFEYLTDVLYMILLCFWGPLYVACGFMLYLNARTRAEGWDIRLAARKIQDRLLGQSSTLWALLLAVFIGFGFSGSLHAEPLPNQGRIEQVRQETLEKPPFRQLKTDTEYCWRSCNKQQQSRHPNIPLPDNIPTPPRPWFNALMYALIGILLGLVLWLLYRWYQANGGFGLNEGEEVPETLFGMKITPESLPGDVAAAVLAEYERDPRAAMSLLYRGSLSQISRRHGLPLRSSDTEGQVLKRVRQRQPQLLDYWQPLTDSWVALAYAHRLPERETVHRLCREYRRVFAESGAPEFSGSLSRAGEGAA
ncbi:hypothetical protein A7P95_08090 [Eikenella longinqua]|uniref:Protein-glutamine gamma-glutamyltransferase-like C-terminal domain-containing protein n=1 Tax=Eikenella longinqua TaxID=1795827 RepID=A0A1A9RWP7_9NEIS|nr:DUF4129 domain-containing protein [Eikenella longinqua]OAM26712.1 hypothetical protein A7P95_08090 [Eikenella longinqua]